MDKSPKRKLRVLHLASFAGNIGDLANHAGARYLWKNLGYDYQYTELEIREFYWKLRRFDDDFVAWANSFDLLLIGGGNYFELWVENSSTGMSIDIAAKQLAQLTVPTIFYSLGLDIGQGYTANTQARFKEFLDHVLSRHENFFVCVRNDGSRSSLREVLGDVYVHRIPVMPDGGFWVGDALNVEKVEHDGFEIGVNIAGDMLDRRFNAELTSEEFLTKIASVLLHTLDQYDDARIVFFPHIWRDIALLSELLMKIPDRYLRRRVRVAELNPTSYGLGRFIADYKNCDLVLGMRFHANVCPISMGIPTIGLFNYPQVKLLYEEISLRDRLVDVRSQGFDQKLLNEIESSKRSISELGTRMRSTSKVVRGQGQDVLVQIGEWLAQHYG